MITIASLIEREARFQDDRPLVASVIYNRLAAGWLLQIDATVLYAKGVWQSSVSLDDRKIQLPLQHLSTYWPSPWTYREPWHQSY